MPKLTVRTPKYRLHRASGQAVVALNGRDIYLGRWNTPESKREYQRLVGQWQTNNGQLAQKTRRNMPTVDEVIMGYVGHAHRYYVKNGKPTSTIYSVRSAVHCVHKLYGRTLADDFGPLALKHVRNQTWFKSGQHLKAAGDRKIPAPAD